MNETPSIFELATVDLVDMFSTDPILAMQHAITILNNPEVADTRIAFLNKLQQISSNDSTHIETDEADFSRELGILRNNDLVEVIFEERIPFSRVIRICSNPEAIGQAFDASLEHFEAEYAKGNDPDRPVELAMTGVWLEIPIPAGLSLVASTAETEKLPSGVIVGVSIDKKRFGVHIPVAKAHLGRIEFPLGFALAVARFCDADGETRIGRLFPVVVARENSAFEGSIALDSFRSHQLPVSIDCYEVKPNSVDVLKMITSGMLDEISRLPIVSTKENLLNGIESIRKSKAEAGV